MLDAWRPVAQGWQRGLRWAQVRASDAVLVPSARAASWLQEEGAGATTHVVPWPFAAPGSTPLRGGTNPGRVLLVAPTPTILGLAAEAVALLGGRFELQVVPPGPALGEALRGAAALLDLGGTSAGVLTEAWALGVPVCFGLLSLADGLPSPLAGRVDPLTPQSLAQRLGTLVASAPAPGAPPSPPRRSVACGAGSPVPSPRPPTGALPEARAALQSLLDRD